MSTEPVTPSEVNEQPQELHVYPPTPAVVVPVERPRPPVRFSPLHWFVTGVIRFVYRLWTRIAVRVFPDSSRRARVARKLHIPLPDTLNMSWVTDHLAVGGRIRPADIKVLSLTGVTHVVDTRSEFCDDAEALAAENISLLHLPTRDTYPLTIEQLMQGSEWVNARISEGGRVLIHCEHGVGRSVLLTCASLVAHGMHGGESLMLVKQKRWQAAPNHHQVKRLREFEAAYSSLKNQV